MMECLNCGQQNKDNALYCCLCGEVLRPRDRSQDEVGLSYTAFPTDDELKRHRITAHCFLLILSGFLLIPILVFLNAWITRHNAPDGGESAGLGAQLLRTLFPIYLMLFYGYLTAMTGKAVGLPFLGNFLLAFFAVGSPAVWARIGGRSPYRPYAYLLASAVVFGVVFYYFPDWPYLQLVAFFCLIPLIIYHLLGGAVGSVATSLGLYPSVVMGWLCLGPIIIFAILVCDTISGGSLVAVHESARMAFNDLAAMVKGEQRFTHYSFPVLSILYLMITLFIWIKVVYEDLKLPNI